ncbi:MAG: hypothetical protein PHW40_07170, partial [Candidatus Izemoplasmatales bacterium]|nr:hypothetical protein [Candidatus Izemoplasmatales bacterium]
MDSGDLVLAIGWHDYAFTGMSGYEITSADYAMHMAGLTISGHYLTQLGVGSYHFSIVTDHGTYPLEIEIIYLSHYQEPSLYFLLGNDVYTLGLNLGLMAQIDLDGAPLLSVTIQDDPVNPAHYVLDGSTLELLPQALDGLSYGSAYRLMVVTEAGTDEALFIVNDIPTIQAKTDFIKYPGEAISDEDWTHLVDNQIGTITYRYECDAEGTFTDHGNGRFSFVPDSIYYGSEIIRLIVEDQYGAHAERAITLTYKQIDPIILDTEIALIVDKRLLANDLGFTVHTYGVEPSTLYFEMIDIREGSLSIGSEHFVLKTDGNPSWFSLKANYLLGLSVGLHTLRLLTEAGFSEFSLDIRDSRPVLAEPQTKTFTIGLSEEDLSFTLTPYEHIVTPSSFTIGIQSWTEGVDFTYIAPVLTIHKAFLETLALGSHTIAINDVETITLIIHTTLSPEVIQDDVLKLYAPLSEAALTIPIDLKGWTGETQVFRYQVPLDQADYTLTDELLTIATGYLDGLSEGYHEFFLINAQGSAGFMLRIAGSPAPSTPDQNVTKFTHEVITAEALRVETQWDASLIGLDLLEVRYYPYLESIEGEGILGIISEDAPASSGVFGTLTLNPDTITFALTRNPGWYGVVVFTYTATDDFGFTSNPIVMDVVYKPLHPDIADHDTKYYVLDTFTDITFTITNHEGNALFPIVDIAYDDETLVMDQDYTVGPEMGAYLYFTILGTYLDGLSGGTHTFVLITAGGRSTFYVHVVAPLSVAEAAEEFDQGHPEDITLTLQGFPLQISELRLQDQVVSSQYWTFAGNQLTLASAFLATLPYGTQDIAVHNGYLESIIKVVITDSRMPILVGSIPTYTQGSWMDKTLTFNLYGESLIALRFQGEAVSLEDYTIHLHQLTIKGSYLESLSALPMLDFTIDTSYGPIPIQMEVVTLITPPEISQTSDPLAID